MPSVDETFRRGLKAMQNGETKTAETCFRRTLERQPRHVGALNLLSLVLQQTNRSEEAEYRLDAAYIAMFERYQAGADPDHIEL